MRVFQTPAELKAVVGEEIGVSDWITVDQARIDTFAEATGDHQWIHVDTARAAREMPGGKTIAHGYLTLSLIPMLAAQIYRVESKTRGVNYGSNRVRFLNPVPAGARVRLHQRLIDAQDSKDGGLRLVNEYTVEIEGADRPACVSETISLIYG